MAALGRAAVVLADEPPHDPAVERRRLRSIVGGSIGNIVEW